MVLLQIGLKLPTNATTAHCHYHYVIIIPHIETNIHFCMQVIKWLASRRAAVPTANRTGHFRVSWIPDTKTIIFFSLMACTKMPGICVGSTGVWIWICLFGSVHYSNDTVCLSHAVAVPVFVEPPLPEYARNAMRLSQSSILPTPSSDRKRCIPTQY